MLIGVNTHDSFRALTLIGDLFASYIVNSSAEEGWLRELRKNAKLP